LKFEELGLKSNSMFYQNKKNLELKTIGSLKFKKEVKTCTRISFGN
jgi:hypothetical protein